MIEQQVLHDKRWVHVINTKALARTLPRWQDGQKEAKNEVTPCSVNCNDVPRARAV
jgi:hypothetical protein